MLSIIVFTQGMGPPPPPPMPGMIGVGPPPPPMPVSQTLKQIELFVTKSQIYSSINVFQCVFK